MGLILKVPLWTEVLFISCTNTILHLMRSVKAKSRFATRLFMVWKQTTTATAKMCKWAVLWMTKLLWTGAFISRDACCEIIRQSFSLLKRYLAKEIPPPGCSWLKIGFSKWLWTPLRGALGAGLNSIWIISVISQPSARISRCLPGLAWAVLSGRFWVLLEIGFPS